MNSITIVVVEKRFEEPRDVCVLRCATAANLLEHAREVKNFLDGRVITGSNPATDELAPAPLKSARNAGVVAAQLAALLQAKPEIYTEIELNPIETNGRDSDYIYTIKVRYSSRKPAVLALSLTKKGMSKLLHREGPVSDFVPENLVIPGV